MRYIKIASTGDLAPGKMMKVDVEDTPVLLANIEGNYYAMDNTCPHMGGSLSAGKLEGRNVICPKHGSVFDVMTGKAIRSGKLLFINVKIHDLNRYPIKVDGSDVLIGLE